MQLQGSATERPDLGGGRPYTFAGRVGNANKPSDLVGMLSQMPTESPDAEGMGAAMTLAGSTIGRQFTRQQLDKTLEKMYRATNKEAGTKVGLDEFLGKLVDNVYYNAGHAGAVKVDPVTMFRRAPEAINEFYPRSGRILNMRETAAALQAAERASFRPTYQGWAQSVGGDFATTLPPEIESRLFEYLSKLRKE